MQKRFIPIIGHIHPDTFSDAAGIIEDLLLAGSPDIAVMISSPGGDVDHGLHLFDLIKNYPGKSTGIVMRGALSMGAVILQACDQRICAQHAEIMIHHISRKNISLDVLEEPSSLRLKNIREGLQQDQKYIYNILTERTGRTLKEIRAACIKETFLHAEEAKRFGLIDAILDRKEMAKWFRSDILDELNRE